ncbi:MAG: ribonuclease H-like domain-containing protein [Nanoarchaeota archaeon]
MLKNSFIHIPYVGYKTEKEIWKAGINSWEEFDTSKLNFPSFRCRNIKEYVGRSISAFESGDHSFFSSHLPKHEHWRCLKDFDKIAYLDIETTGLDKERDDITMIGVYDGDKTKIFVKGEDFLSFSDYIKKFPLIVTFNGSCFDLPFLSSKFNINFDQLHVDLRFAFSKLGYSGGLKRIERIFGLNRSSETQGLDGFEAVRLWHRYVNGDDSALELLKRYNEEDVVGLKTLGERVYEGLKERLVESIIQ